MKHNKKMFEIKIDSLLIPICRVIPVKKNIFNLKFFFSELALNWNIRIHKIKFFILHVIMH